MPVICPTVLATDPADYARQIQNVTSFADRIQIDLMDGKFAKAESISLDDVWWPAGLTIDIHLMYQNPFDYLETLIHLKPNMVIVHVETMIHHMHFAAELHKEGMKAGLAVMPDTPVANVEQIINSFDHLLIFSGDLGHFGGKADLSLVSKAREAKEHHPELEIGWDGGVNIENAKILADGGVDVLNVGGFIQKADNPDKAYKTLVDTVN